MPNFSDNMSIVYTPFPKKNIISCQKSIGAIFCIGLMVLGGCKEEPQQEPNPKSPPAYEFEDFATPTGYEPVVFAIDSKSSKKYPDWKEKARNAIDSVNFIYQKTTQKKYFISRFITYHLDYFVDIDYNKNYRVKYKGQGGITIKLWIKPLDYIPNPNKKYTARLGIGTHVSEEEFQNDRYTTVNLILPETTNIIHTDQGYDNSNYWEHIYVLVHELGHANGLAVPDIYNYIFKDTSGIEPVLPKYDLNLVQYKDPMLSFPGISNNKDSLQFNELHSKIIELNEGHKYSMYDIKEIFVADSCKVLVKDGYGMPLENVEVRVYPVKLYANSFNFIQQYYPDLTAPLETLFTDKEGQVAYEPPSADCRINLSNEFGCAAKVLKVFYNGQIQAKYVKHYDLMEDFVVHGKTMHLDEFVFE